MQAARCLPLTPQKVSSSAAAVASSDFYRFWPAQVLHSFTTNFSHSPYINRDCGAFSLLDLCTNQFWSKNQRVLHH